MGLQLTPESTIGKWNVKVEHHVARIVLSLDLLTITASVEQHHNAYIMIRQIIFPNVLKSLRRDRECPKICPLDSWPNKIQNRTERAKHWRYPKRHSKFTSVD